MPDYSAMSKGLLPGEEVPQKRKGRPPLPRDRNGNIIRTGDKKKKISKPTSKDNQGPLEWSPMCACCGKTYSEWKTNFVTSSSPLYMATGGYIPICRDCLARYYQNVILPAVDDDEKTAVETFCSLCDWYYDDDILNVAVQINEQHRQAGNKTPVAITYGQRRNMTNWVKRGTTYLDTVRRRWEANKVVQNREDLEGGKHEEIDEEDVWFFGPGYTASEYRYLREQYGDWCERYDCQLKAQEEIFKMLSIAQLNVQKAQQAGEAKKATEAIRTLQDLMSTAKIQPKQKDSAALTEQNTFGTLIRQWENEKPIPEPAPEWRDVDNIKRYIGAYFLGHLCKMFKIDNEWSQIYEEEMAENTAERPRDTAKADSDANELTTKERMAQMRAKNSSRVEDGS